ncbi:porin [Massilia dura]|uniref:Porin n=1 Tax=Pseudoduganella dura TaxID=321982 RepID=A0A6I3XGC4_9BURK|nr:porin [Pseudoduganella dura]MUI15419.1 porin [Pseudoduganella dura]GGX80042.1 porin [Pseudoduganella dura]
MCRPHRTAAGRLIAFSFFASALLPLVAVHAADGVQLYGLLGTYAGSIRRSDSTAHTAVIGSGGLTTSWWGVRGSEDLDDGMKAVFQLEQFFQPDTGGAGRTAADPAGFSRSAWVGLAGRFGQLTLGRHTSPYYLSMQQVNPFGASVVFSPLVVQSYVAAFGSTVIGDTVWNNTIQYIAPTFGGLGTTIVYAPGETAGKSGIANAGLHWRYVRGKLTAVLSAQRMRTAAVAPSTGQKAYLTGLSYDAGWARLYASVQTTDNAVTDIASRTWQLGTAVPVTQGGSILASWATTTGRNPAAAVARRDTLGIGYDHYLSRRTDVYVTYLYDKIHGKASGSSYALGIRHLF